MAFMVQGAKNKCESMDPNDFCVDSNCCGNEFCCQGSYTCSNGKCVKSSNTVALAVGLSIGIFILLIAGYFIVKKTKDMSQKPANTSNSNQDISLNMTHRDLNNNFTVNDQDELENQVINRRTSGKDIPQEYNSIQRQEIQDYKKIKKLYEDTDL